MDGTVEGAGVELAFQEKGHGPPLLLIHGLAGDALSWSPVAERLAGRARVIAYDRRGYGDSGSPVPYERTTVYEQSEDAATLLRAIDAAPALVCAEGFGALIALDLLIRQRPLVSAAVLGDPPLFAFVPQATEALGAERELLVAAVRERGLEGAVALWLGGRVSGDALRRAQRAHRALFADFGGLSSWPVTRAELRGIDVPVAVVTGAPVAPHIAGAADALAELVPGAQRRRDGDLGAAVLDLLG